MDQAQCLKRCIAEKSSNNYNNINTITRFSMYRYFNLRCVYSAGKLLYSYVALVPAPSCILWQYKFVHKFAGTLDTAF